MKKNENTPSMQPIPFDKREGFIWFNGEIIPWQDAKIHVLNHGLHYASCVFEGLRVYNRKAFKLSEHNQRLHKSAEMLGFKIPYSIKELNKAVEAEVEAQNIVDGYVRPVAWRGSEQMAILTTLTSTNVAVAAWTWPAYYTDEGKRKGIRLTLAKWKRPSPETAPSMAKASGLYMIATMSKNLAYEQGYDEALMLDWQGRVAETTSSNIFFVKNGELHTPLADCFLDGITRQTVIELAKKHKIKVSERRILPSELPTFEEAFCTGSAAEVTPIASIDENGREHKYTVGKTTLFLIDEYSNLVRG
ncbi:MAG: branched-chain amino acid aminotransferase [Alphaproteobacteria bacterium]|jgi:branched-chain amino acid aminotransferase